MRKLILALAVVFSFNVLSYATEAVPVNTIQTKQTQTAATPNAVEETDNFTNDASEEAKKKRRKKKKKKNPVVKWIVGGAIAAAALVLYIVTDGEGYNSRG